MDALDPVELDVGGGRVAGEEGDGKAAVQHCRGYRGNRLRNEIDDLVGGNDADVVIRDER